MRAAIIGAGSVGLSLGRRLSGSGGVALAFGVREGKDLSQEVASFSVAPKVLSVQEAVDWGDLIFLAVPGGVAVEVAASLEGCEEKILIDCTNPIRWDNGPVWDPPEEGSVTAAIAARLPGVPVLKAFNTFGAEFHGDPSLAGSLSADVPIAGDDLATKDLLAGLCQQMGFVPVDAGPLRNAALLENLATLWIHLATVGGHGRDFAFKLIRR